VNFFFDNNLPPALARGIGELSRNQPGVSSVIHLRDRFPPDTKDEEWVTELSTQGGWVVISQDQFKKGEAEKEALRSSGMIIFSLARPWNDHTFWPKAQNLIRWWPAIVDQAGRFSGGAAFRVPWRYSGKGKFEQIRVK
jgi:hypothetical protein